MSWSASHRSSDRIVWYGATTATVLVMGTLWIRRRRRALQKPPKSIQDVRGNSYTKASDVVALYSHVPPGKVYVVTGATSGLGRFTAVLLGQAGAHVILGVRNVAQGDEVRQEILDRGGTATVVQLDLTSLESTRQFCHEVKQLLVNLQQPVVHGIINNAGIYGVKGTTSTENIKKTWQVNALAPALLTELLLPVLDRDIGRVIHVSSEMYRALLWRRVSDYCPPTTASSDGSTSFDYALSKACQIIHAHALNLQFAAGSSSSRRRAMAIEPGLVHTNIGRHKGKWNGFFTYSILGPFILRTVDQGCASIVFCLLAPPEHLGRDNKDGGMHHYYANCAPKAVSKSVDELDQVMAQTQLFDSLLAKYRS